MSKNNIYPKIFILFLAFVFLLCGCSPSTPLSDPSIPSGMAPARPEDLEKHNQSHDMFSSIEDDYSTPEDSASSTVLPPESSLYEVTIPGKDLRAYLHYDGVSIWYQVLDDDYNAKYYKHTVATGKTRKLGEISDIAVVGGDTALADNGLYIYAKTLDSTSHLLFLSFENDNVVEVSQCDIFNLIPMDFYGGMVYSLKGYTDNSAGTETTFLDSFDPETNKETVLISAISDTTDKLGNGLVEFDIYDGNIYVYYLNADKPGEVVASIRVYDLEGSFQKEISLSNLTTNSLREFCTGIEVNGDYIYLYNHFSAEGIIGKISNNEIEELVTDNYCYCAPGFIQNKTIITSIKSSAEDTDKIYVCDVAKQTVEEFELELEDGEYITNILVCGDNILLITDNGGTETITVTTLNLLTSNK